MIEEYITNLKHIHRVFGDGNCLLRAIALQTNKTHEDLREELYLEYISVTEYYSPFFINIYSYIEQIKNTNVWCGEEDISALANVVNANIELYIDTIIEPYMTYKCREGSDKVIGIIYVNGNHYDAVLRERLKCDAICCNECSVMSCDKCLQNFCENCENGHYCICSTINKAAKIMYERMNMVMGIE